ncbi:hypothetical protein Xcel_1676 [Xylanimonas cellulosilytica DSM 15894]|uniref:AbiEi antitoxin C-terminal domain-containing protein n=1 Tax=Xylanimonas cellulosilytica (strain DSM 15894 / JCM 12276 / CECT 5975 / KCTC 9989 / LMG 20990 / NBRC 107835 / XIL07) TaxID=446471 RepID=D1BSK7_XYLCX|nr:hypothetical protein [Xylanimonas cellulosilytica]ACZ30699.1 hypothetical protein Xcel_1676 [Xylanimonas cellulosilytica DSM 15894]
MEPAVVSALLAPPRAPSLVVRPADVGGRVAWDLLVRDGALRVLDGDAAVPVHAPVTPETRAAALRPRVPARTVVTGPSAAWVHCGGPPPDRLVLAHRTGTHRPEVWTFATVWSGPGLVSDSVRLAGVRVTTPERTAVEVALRLPPARSLRLVLDLQSAGADLAAASRALERRTRAPGRPQAREVLAAARDRVASVGAKP